MKVYGANDALAALEHVASGREDHVYRTDNSVYCRNFDDQGQPSCIVGHVLALWDLPRPLRDALQGGVTASDVRDALDAHANPPFRLTYRAVNVLLAAQNVQDSVDNTWGEALASARAAHAAIVKTPEDQ